MNYAELYEKQYRLGKLEAASFPRLRHWLRDYDLTPQQIALRLLPPGGTLFDAGCNDGDLCFLLESRFEQIVGLDVSPSAIQRCRERAVSQGPGHASKYQFLVGNLDEPLPLPSDSADAVTAMAVIEHVFDCYRLVAELYRVLKPKGRALFQVPNVAYVRHRWTFLRGRLPNTSDVGYTPEYGWDGGHLHYFTLTSFCELLTWAGFKIQHKTGSGLLGDFRNWWPSLLTGDLIVLAEK